MLDALPPRLQMKSSGYIAKLATEAARWKHQRPKFAECTNATGQRLHLCAAACFFQFLAAQRPDQGFALPQS